MSLIDSKQIIRTKGTNDSPSVAMVMRIFSAKGGLELYAHRLVEGLLDNNYLVTVFCEDLRSDLIHPNLSIIRLRNRPKGLKKRELLNYYFREFTRALEDHGPFDIIHSQQVAIENVDVAHFHNQTLKSMCRQGKPWECLFNRFKLAVVPAYKERDKYDRSLASRAKILLFPSALNKRDYEDAYDLLSFRDPASHIVAYPGADPIKNGKEQDRSESSQSNKGEAPVNFLFVGKGYRRKGADVLLSACQILSRRGFEFTLSIAGLKEKRLNRIRLIGLGLKNHVKYLGFQSDMGAVYRNAQAVVLPSRIDAFGMAPLEGMRYGVVPIVSAACGIAEVLTDERDALILKDHLDAAELAQLMTVIIENKQSSEAMSAQTRHTAERFTWASMVETVMDSYKLIMPERNLRPKIQALETPPVSASL